MTIGVLDDNASICHLLETLLIFAGYAVYATTNPTDFAANINYLECIVVDFQLSGRQSGVDVIRQARNAHPHLPAVLVSASPIPQKALKELGDVAILAKPFSSSMLLEAISAVQKGSTEPLW